MKKALRSRSFAVSFGLLAVALIQAAGFLTTVVARLSHRAGVVHIADGGDTPAKGGKFA